MPPHFPYCMKPIYELLDEKEKSWRIYFHDMPQAATLAAFQTWSSPRMR